MKTILITGGTGFIGSALTKALLSRSYEVRHLSRAPQPSKRVKSFRWSLAENHVDPEALEGIDVIIHLAGAPVAPKRWTAQRVRLLDESRSATAAMLARKVEEGGHKPTLFISSSGAHYHGAILSDHVFREGDPAGHDVMGTITQNWEAAADLFAAHCRVVKLRTPLVLGADGGGLPLMTRPVKLGLGSPLGSGKQWMPWVHIADLARAYLLAIDNVEMRGSYHVTAPEHVTNSAFMSTLAMALSRPFWAPRVPAFILKLLLGEQAVILLNGFRIDSSKISDAGLTWEYPDLESALINTVG